MEEDTKARKLPGLPRVPNRSKDLNPAAFFYNIPLLPQYAMAWELEYLSKKWS